MGEIEDYLKKLEEIKQKSYKNYTAGNMPMAYYYRKKYFDILDNHGLKGID